MNLEKIKRSLHKSVIANYWSGVESNVRVIDRGA